MSAIAKLHALPHEDGPSTARAPICRQARRAYFSPDTLRAHRLAAGDWALLKSESNIVIIQCWPKHGTGEEAVLLSLTCLDNLAGPEVELYRFREEQSDGRLASISIKEIPAAEASSSSKGKAAPLVDLNSSREQAWCKAAVKEALIILRYMRIGYTFTIGDAERAPIYFQVTSVEVSQKDTEKRKASLENGLADLKIATEEEDIRVYEMHWKTVIHLEGEKEQKSEKVLGDSVTYEGRAPTKGPATLGPVPSYINLFHPSQSHSSAYTFLGGLQSQIEQIKTLLDLPMLHPDFIDPALRRPGRFDREIEIGIPDIKGRQEILEILLSKVPHSLTRQDISSLATRTHGYVGADLFSLVRESASTAISRHYNTLSTTVPEPLLTNIDINTTMPSIRPSAMREVFVETPAVRWSDIGGQQEVKQKLKECIEWPLTHQETFKRLGVEAPRGVLLYGPPGCSKTMTAKALATESGINFLAVKGPELLNKYVGESERAVREIFRKARAASPSIIFFDEIDALGSARSNDAAHSGVLTSLLNEMDGVEELSGVTVVAATNRPDMLDAALMRPGRLDRILYVGPPDLETRMEILRIKLATMAVEEGVDVEELARITRGCSGAEVVSICQDAALAAMNEDINAPYVKKSHLVHSAKTVRRRITSEIMEFFEEWGDQSGIRSA
ncbi:uncharacterized protein L203_101390 [Cryptococcus depauperatus CBS 7841]|uniref:AAA+ ATPase domain-containing protein n=1 Tax=Cryptococcus depauperatus CBS 7841 TaxID=1295531 RepID=A0AAJ8JPU4_9TREE